MARSPRPCPGPDAGDIPHRIFIYKRPLEEDFLTGNVPMSVVTADFNGDTKLDLAVVNSTSNSLSLLLGDGFGSFTGSVVLPVGSNPSSLVVADFDGDGRASATEMDSAAGDCPLGN